MLTVEAGVSYLARRGQSLQFKLPTITIITTALKIKKDRLYRILDSQDQNGWPKLLRSFAYQRTITIIKNRQILHESNQNRNLITISVDNTAFASSGTRMPLVSLVWDNVLTRSQAPAWECEQQGSRLAFLE